MPERYERVSWEPWHSQSVRRVSVGNYMIYYLVNQGDHGVEIVRIFYGRRDVEEIIGELP